MNCTDFLVQLLLALLCGLAFSPLVIAAALAYYLLVMAREVTHGREMEALRIQSDLGLATIRHELGESEQHRQPEQQEAIPEIQLLPKEAASVESPA